MSTKKKFLFKDKTGRGIKSVIDADQLNDWVSDEDKKTYYDKNIDDEDKEYDEEVVDWNTDQHLIEFLEESEIGDDFETRTMKLSRID